MLELLAATEAEDEDIFAVRLGEHWQMAGEELDRKSVV